MRDALRAETLASEILFWEMLRRCDTHEVNRGSSCWQWGLALISSMGATGTASKISEHSSSQPNENSMGDQNIRDS